MSDQPCRLLSWDTEFFGRRIATVNSDRLTADSEREITSFCERENIDCLYFRARTDDAETVRLAEATGYHLVDVRMTWSCELRAPAVNKTCRPAVAGDLPGLHRIARVSHTDSRFYYDSHFAREKCDALYEAWITKAFNRSSVLVADEAGYVTCDLLNPDEGSIGLIAVDQSHQGRGIGTALVHAAMERFRSAGASTVSVVTQGRNLAAQRLYGRCGFIVTNVQLYYHRWFGKTPGPPGHR